MAEEIDENGFYREDFSTKSNWEEFNAQLVEILNDWNVSTEDKTVPLDKDQLFTANWDVKVVKFRVAKEEFTVSLYEAEFENKPETVTENGKVGVFSDLMNLNNTFWPPIFNDAHIIARWYGIRRFIVIQLVKNYITTAADCTFYMSSANVVATETGSTIPIFTPVFNPAWNFYLGVWVDKNVRLNFDVVALEVAPSSCKYLGGLMTIFKEKVRKDQLSVCVSVRQTYNLGNMTKYMMRMKVPFFRNPSTESELPFEESPMEGTYFVALPSGYFSDSSTEILVHCTWPQMSENVVIDTANFTELVPMKAYMWSVRIIGNVKSYLTSALDDYLDLQHNSQTIESLVGCNYGSPVSSGDKPNPLEQLTKPKFVPSASPLRKWSPQKKLAGPIKESELQQMMSYIFPDMQKDSFYPYSSSLKKDKKEMPRIKSAGFDSMVVRLSCLLATVHSHFGGKKGMAQLWANFTTELRYRVDNCLQIPGVCTEYPDMHTCLLNQKLQMLNVCLERRRVRECGLPFGATKKTVKTVDASEEGELTDDEDEFFDCSDEDSAGGSVNTMRPLGRQSRLGEMKLIDSDEYLYVPALQEPTPKTEDQLDVGDEDMRNLGPESGSSTRLMFSSLQSDMECFKAANPKAKIEDFIRWYSPRDWEEETDENGQVTKKLSVRMTTPGNTWQTMWNEAEPIPAYRQKRLFDDTMEAQKVLQYLESNVTIGDIFELTIATLLHSATLKIKDVVSYSNILEIFQSKIDDILTDIATVSQVAELDVSPFEVIKKIENLETALFEYKNLEKLFPKCPPNDRDKEIMSKLIEKEEVFLPGAARNYFARRIVDKYRVEVATADTRTVFAEPTSKEYVIRMDTDKSSSGPNFMRTIVSGQRVRLCSAFADSTTFI